MNINRTICKICGTSDRGEVTIEDAVNRCAIYALLIVTLIMYIYGGSIIITGAVDEANIFYAIASAVFIVVSVFGTTILTIIILACIGIEFNKIKDKKIISCKKKI